MDRETFLEQLGSYGDMARNALRSHLPVAGPQDHLYGPIRDYVETSGKGLRPALVIATCKAFGGEAADAVISAAALELLHNAFLIHDDIEDLSEFRRGRPTMHERLGVPLAINAGDAMQALALRMLRTNTGQLGPVAAMQVLDEFDHLLVESLEGQAMELGWIRDNDVTVTARDYLRMSLKKTCWYSFIHPCRIGATIARRDSGGISDDRKSAFNAFGFLLGAAFQIQDDILNLEGAQKTYGKEICGDIYEGKRTLMLTRFAHLANPQEHRRLKDFLSLPRAGRKPQDVEWIHERMRQLGCIAHAQSAARDLVQAARVSFGQAFDGTDGADRDFVAHLLDYMIEREV